MNTHAQLMDMLNAAYQAHMRAFQVYGETDVCRKPRLVAPKPLAVFVRSATNRTRPLPVLLFTKYKKKTTIQTFK